MLTTNNFIHRVYHKIKLLIFSKRSIDMYIASSEKISDYNTKIERADFQLAVAVHSIEKGLGCKDIKKDFGIDKVQRICGMMENYQKNGYPENKFGFMEGYAIVKAYIEYKKSVNEDLANIEERFDKIVADCKISHDVLDSYNAGKVIYNRDEIECKNPDEIIDFIKKCRSVRNYASIPVKEEDINKAIALANYAPSACNRQPVKCYYTLDSKKIDEVDSIIPGNGLIKGKTPNYIVVTSQMTHFGRDEYNQWYVNGGIYLAYLREALCVYNIGNCIYQWSLMANDKRMREIYEIPDSEVIIGIIGIGYYDEESHCIIAQRK